MKNTKKLLMNIVLACTVFTIFSFTLVGCGKSEKSDKYYVSSDTTYSMIEGSSSVMDIPFSIVSELLQMTPADASVTLTTDGKFKLKLDINNGNKINEVITLIAGMLPTPPVTEPDPDVNPDEEVKEGIDLDGILNTYGKHLFPGLDLDNVVQSLEIIRKTLGISFTGIDWASPETTAFIKYIEANHALPNLDELVFPESGFGIEFNGIYYIKDLYGENSKGEKTTFKAVHVGLQDIQEDPFLLFTISYNHALDKEILTGQVKFIKLKIEAVKL